MGWRAPARMRAARSTASSSDGGLPSIRATGRSSTVWLRNQALPRTQAFLALVILWPSTVSSMSSQTQPQKVQVALLTIFSSVGISIPSSVHAGRECLDLYRFCEQVQARSPDDGVRHFANASSDA